MEIAKEEFSVFIDVTENIGRSSVSRRLLLLSKSSLIYQEMSVSLHNCYSGSLRKSLLCRRVDRIKLRLGGTVICIQAFVDKTPKGEKGKRGGEGEIEGVEKVHRILHPISGLAA